MVHQVTISISDEVLSAIEKWRLESGTAGDVESAVEHALDEWFTRQDAWGGREYRQASSSLQITPADVGSGRHDISVDHDRYLAEL